LHLIPWLLGTILILELVVLIGVGLVSTQVLRQVARIEPLNRIAVPLALRFPRSRRKIFRHYVDELKGQIARDKRTARGEQYIPLPATIMTKENPAGTIDAEPVNAILGLLTNSRNRGSILIESPGGRGKSALLRGIVEAALVQYDCNPRNPLPILLAHSGDDIEKLIQAKLNRDLLTPELLTIHLEAGDFFLVVDGVSELHFDPKVLDTFLHSRAGEHTPLLLTSRPNKEYNAAIQGAAHWMLVEPMHLDDSNLDLFVKKYGGNKLDESLQMGCRVHDSRDEANKYLPILVRMAVMIETDNDDAKNVAGIYKRYFFHLIRDDFKEDKDKFNYLEMVAAWCLETYWVDGGRKRSYKGGDLPLNLLRAGLLIGNRPELPDAIWFFHDSMQSFLTAYGLVHLTDYSKLPHPTNDDSTQAWDQAQVLFRIASAECFSQQEGSIYPWDGSELFQMYLAISIAEGKHEVLETLLNTLLRWADVYCEELQLSQIVTAIQPSGGRLRREFEEIRTTSDQTINKRQLLLKLAADTFFNEFDKFPNRLPQLYIGLAPIIRKTQKEQEHRKMDESK
jgi:hypothetical protein